ncbi:hypothetical protein CDAR_205111 [Caerostris darwini]|uniref:Uncharacterized protein n=1 Tax=Caerostris darwini TaxID=1538125 RepID=A0AAV4PT11_9ARAC|nr:hypothetical protein CDAR_205111 [Caerostris darwini]
MGGTFQGFYSSRKESSPGDFEGGSKRGWSKEIEMVVTVPRNECAPPLSSMCQTLYPVSHFFLYPEKEILFEKRSTISNTPASFHPHCLKIRWRRHV